MKKKGLSIVAMLLAVAMLLTLCACGDAKKSNRADDDEDEKKTSQTTVLNDEDKDEEASDNDEETAMTTATTRPQSDAAPYDPSSVVGEWQGTIMLDNWVKALIGEPEGTQAEVALMTTLYDVLFKDLAVDYYMVFNADGTLEWKMKDTFFTDMMSIVSNNTATYTKEDGVYELMATQGLDKAQTDAVLQAQGMTAEEYGNILMTALTSGLNQSLSEDNVTVSGAQVKDGFYVGLGEYRQEDDQIVVITADGTENAFAFGMSGTRLDAKLFYFGGQPVVVELTRV